MYISFGFNKFLAPLSGTENFLNGSTKILSYTDYIIQFCLNKFLAQLPGTEKFLSGSTKSLSYTDHIIQFGLNNVLVLLPGNRIDEFKDHYSNQKGIY